VTASVLSDKKIVESWKKNAQPWVSAVRNGEIESRVLVTNEAIVNAVIGCKPRSVLDLGCGEGWLVRALDKAAIEVLGVDVVPELIASAEKEGGGRFRALSYEELTAYVLKESFDVVVCNFSLFGKAAVEQVFKHVPSLLNMAGYFIIQTIHPRVGWGESAYVDGWREGSWCGFNDAFSDPAPWYFRTLETWQSLFEQNGFKLALTLEPENPLSKEPASIIFVGAINKSQ